MKREHLPLRAYVTNLASSGRYDFSPAEARFALGTSPAATKLALSRLAKQGAIASPARGFYIIVPPEYRSLGSLPADQFIPALMKRLGLPYYVGLLSAAQYHGAAHHRPQQFQVMLPRNRRPIRCGSVQVTFFARKRIAEVPHQSFNTPRGTIEVSTPEATAIDLIGYQHSIGGLDQVATILSELAERIDPVKLADAAKTAPPPWAQRLGYLLEQIGADDALLRPLQDYVKDHASRPANLLPAPSKNATTRRSEKWKLVVNADIQAET